MKVLKIVTHFSVEDPEFISDYVSVEVFLDGNRVASYGDAYHDRGAEKARGFEDGVRALFPDVQVVRERVADEVI